MQVKFVLSSLFGIIGTVFVLLGCIFWRIQAVKNSYTGLGEARVVSIERRYNSSSHSSYYFPQLEFMVEGKQYFLKSSVGTSDAKDQEGQQVMVRYNPDNPQQFQIEGDNAWKILKIVFLSLGSLFVVLAAVLFLVL